MSRGRPKGSNKDEVVRFSIYLFKSDVEKVEEVRKKRGHRSLAATIREGIRLLSTHSDHETMIGSKGETANIYLQIADMLALEIAAGKRVFLEDPITGEKTRVFIPQIK